MLRLNILAFAALGLALLATDSYAGSGPTISLPMGRVKPKSGLLLTLDGRGVDANGYRPIRVEIRPIGGAPLPADRQLRIVIGPSGYNQTTAGVPSVSQIVELPEGHTVVTATIAVPQTGIWSSLEITTYEDGEILRDLSIPGIGWNTSGYWDWTEARPTILVIDSDVPASSLRPGLVATFRARGTDPKPTYNLPDPSVLSNIFPDPNRGGIFNNYPGSPKPSDVTLLSQVDQMQRIEMLPPAELPERWIELSQYDMAIIAFDELSGIAKSQPEKMAALAAWARTGPLLVVYGVGDDFDRLSQLEQLLQLPRLPAKGDTARYQGWTPADPARHLTSVHGDASDAQLGPPMAVPYQTYGPYGGMAMATKAYATKPMPSGDEKPLPSPAEPPFVLRINGLGKLVAIASDQPFPGVEDDWKWIFNCVARNHWSWYQRNGFSLHRENVDYWTFLIPGVGQAPVLSFLLLVTMFAVVIGPLNYAFLKRSRRLYLLLITVPAGAGIVTLALFGYAMVTDGLGVRLRARSFTDLDQPAGTAVAWSRQTYYASIAPSRGLVFPEDCTIFPVIGEPEARSGNGPNQVLTWIDGQNLKSGYIASRTQGQFMVQRSTTAQEKLVVKEGARAGQPPQATNQLGADIEYVLLRDSRGDYFAGQNLAADAAEELAATTPAIAEAMLAELHGEHPLANPRSYDPTRYNSLLSELMPDYNWGGNIDAGAATPIMATSLLETNLVLATRPQQHPPVPRTYIAVIERSPVVPYGVPRVRQQASFHVIRGRY